MNSFFELTELQREIHHAAREFLTAHAGPAPLRDSPRAQLGDDWRAAGELGWFELLQAEEHGGLGLGPVEAGLLLEEAGALLHYGPLLETMLGRSVIAACLELSSSTAVTLALSGDSEVGIQIDSLPSLDASGLHGELGLVPFADLADLLLVCGSEGKTPVLAVVRLDAPGVGVRRLASADPVSRPCAVELRAVIPEVVVSRAAIAELELERIFSLGFALTAVRAVGVMRGALDLAVQYAKDREQFGRAIGSFQAVQQRLAEMAVCAVAGRSACVVALGALESGSPEGDRRARVAKAYCSRGVRFVVEGALQTLGGIGFTEDHDFHFYLKHGLSLAVAWGEADAHEEWLAASLLGRREDTASIELAPTTTT